MSWRRQHYFLDIARTSLRSDRVVAAAARPAAPLSAAGDHQPNGGQIIRVNNLHVLTAGGWVTGAFTPTEISAILPRLHLRSNAVQLRNTACLMQRRDELVAGSVSTDAPRPEPQHGLAIALRHLDLQTRDHSHARALISADGVPAQSLGVVAPTTFRGERERFTAPAIPSGGPVGSCRRVETRR